MLTPPHGQANEAQFGVTFSRSCFRNLWIGHHTNDFSVLFLQISCSNMSRAQIMTRDMPVAIPWNLEIAQGAHRIIFFHYQPGELSLPLRIEISWHVSLKYNFWDRKCEGTNKPFQWKERVLLVHHGHVWQWHGHFGPGPAGHPFETTFWHFARQVSILPTLQAQLGVKPVLMALCQKSIEARWH